MESFKVFILIFNFVYIVNGQTMPILLTTKPPPPTFVTTATVPKAPTTNRPSAEQLLDELIANGESLKTKTETELVKLRSQNNYFVKEIQGELNLLSTTLEDLKQERALANVDSGNQITQGFLIQAEMQVTRHELYIQQLIQLAEKSTNDAHFNTLTQMVDAVLTRAYTDIGKLTMENKETLAKPIETQISEIDKLKEDLQLLNYEVSKDRVEQTIAQLIQHVRDIEQNLYRLEKLNHSIPN